MCTHIREQPSLRELMLVTMDRKCAFEPYDHGILHFKKDLEPLCVRARVLCLIHFLYFFWHGWRRTLMRMNQVLLGDPTNIIKF